MKRTLMAVVVLFVLAGCQSTPPTTLDALPDLCSKPKITEHCATVWVKKNASNKNVITVDPPQITLSGHRRFHWILWVIDDSQSTTPGKYTFSNPGVTTSSLQFYNCYRAALAGNRMYACYDYNNVEETIEYQVNLLDAAGNSAPIDPLVFNDG